MLLRLLVGLHVDSAPSPSIRRPSVQSCLQSSPHLTSPDALCPLPSLCCLTDSPHLTPPDAHHLLPSPHSHRLSSPDCKGLQPPGEFCYCVTDNHIAQGHVIHGSRWFPNSIIQPGHLLMVRAERPEENHAHPLSSPFTYHVCCIPSASLGSATSERIAGGRGPFGQQAGHRLFRFSCLDSPVDKII